MRPWVQEYHLKNKQKILKREEVKSTIFSQDSQYETKYQFVLQIEIGHKVYLSYLLFIFPNMVPDLHNHMFNPHCKNHTASRTACAKILRSAA